MNIPKQDRTPGRVPWLRGLCAAVLAVLLFSAGMETVYRLQLVDCYRGELGINNRQRDLDDSGHRKTLLIMGDSFAVHPDAFSFDLRASLSGEWRSINSAVSGTGVVQALLMARRRFRSFHPRVFLYQIYVGNDLFDLRYPLGWGRVSMGRSLYWMVATHFRSLAWLNYKLAQIGRPHERIAFKSARKFCREKDNVFSPRRFTFRDRIYARAEPGMVADSVMLQGRRRRDFDRYIRLLDDLLEYCDGIECRAVVLVIPHFSQVGPEEARRAREIGFRIPENGGFFNPDYPFVHKLTQHLLKTRPDVLVINPLGAFQKERRAGEILYYRNDSHLSPFGQHFLAGRVLEEMRAAGVIGGIGGASGPG